ncbi:MAG: hypothetical protein E5W93_00715 [Mesorhizobium sp.]|nr:MAG: hypothetical protein E5W93_00715 [Mesorhizobium sp.]
MTGRLQTMLTEEELAAVENWRFEKRMPRHSATVRELLRRGLAAEGFLTAETGMKSQGESVCWVPNGTRPKIPTVPRLKRLP